MQLFKRLNQAIAIALSFFFFLSADVEAAEGIRVHFINCGYGDCILVELGTDETLLIDAGGNQYATNLLKYLKKRNVRKIDTVIITHPHQNHFEGLMHILKTIPVNDILINGDENAEDGFSPLLALISKKQIPLGIVGQGSRIKTKANGVSIDILHPANLSGNTNENSLVTQIKYFDIMFLLTADIGLMQQDDLVTNFPEIRFANVVQVPHHGGPLSQQFIRAFLNPIFVISTERNVWGIPASEDLEKLGGNPLRTDQNGTIIFESDGQTIRIIENRDPK